MKSNTADATIAASLISIPLSIIVFFALFAVGLGAAFGNSGLNPIRWVTGIVYLWGLFSPEIGFVGGFILVYLICFVVVRMFWKMVFKVRPVNS